MKIYKLAGEWIKYFVSAKSAHGIHSPFLFELYNNVLLGRVSVETQAEFNRIRKELLKDDTPIFHQDFGAGSKLIKTPYTQINNLAKASTKKLKEAGMIARLVDFIQPQNLLELGTSFGTTTALIAKLNPEVQISTVEGSVEIAKKAQQLFNFIPNNKISLHTGAFDILLPDLLSRLTSVESVIFDGNHRKEATMKYFSMCLDFSTPKSFYIFDDIRWSDDMLSAWRAVENHPKTTLTIDLFSMGIAFINPELSKQNISLKF